MLDFVKKILGRILLSRVLKMLQVSICILFPAAMSAYAENTVTKNIWSQDPYFTWISVISVPVSSLYITVDGSSVDSGSFKTSSHSGTAHVSIPLKYGKSNLVVIQAGNAIVFSANVFYTPAYYSTLAPSDYEFNPFHTEVNEKPCLPCHRLTIGANDTTPSKPSESICFPCHKSEFSGLEFQHKEAGVNWECLKCHQTEAMETDYSVDVPARFAIKESSKAALLCYTCHTKNETEFSGYKYIHGPVAIAKCNMCHNPHGSSIRHMLRKDSSTMCLECHGKQDMMKQAIVHEPVIKQGCTGCHDPHGSSFPFFLAAEVKDLCLKCHPKTDKQKNNHPVNGHPVSGANDPINPGRQLTCSSCHDPHSSTFDKLLPVEEVMMICTKCHSIGG
ncbi:MAG: hypothetical protein C4538_05315 [Nitrospiraceae bacterium]|nr:MAG: hypothetical protein C4538_05315 [Nitrospiraceae bacterium]